jgi:hypothetical protein
VELVLSKDKETKGAIRYADMQGHNLYFRKEEVEALGTPAPKHILVKVEVMKEG